MVLMTALVVLLPVVLMAQTEVSGEVSGEWTAEDSPYIVVDSTWIPEDEELRIGPGVDVLFDEGLGLDVFGTLTAEGTEDDSVRFMPVEEDEEWRNIYTHGEEAEINFNYCHVHGGRGFSDGRYYILITSRGAIVNINNSNILGDRAAICANYCEIGLRRSRLSTMVIGHSTVIIWGSRFIASESEIFAARDEDGDYRLAILTGEGGHCILERTTVFGNMDMSDAYFTNFTDCEFTSASLGYRGIIRNCVIRGTLRSSVTIGFEILNNIVEGEVRLHHFSGKIERNTVTGQSVYIDCRSQRDSVFISNCDFNITASMDLGGTGNVFVDNCRITGCIQADNNVNLDIRRSTIINCMNLRIQNGHSLILQNNSIFVSNISSAIHNTAISVTSNDYRNHRIKNNIIYIPECDEENRLFKFTCNDDDIYPDVSYNCFFGYDHLLYNPDDRWNFDFDLDGTNIIQDPMFVLLDSLDLHLQPGSPCIDTGDPDSPLDPDSTRADIGAYYHDQRVSVPLVRNPIAFNLDLLKVYPNPFNSETTISYRLVSNVNVTLGIYDPGGRLVDLLHDGFLIGREHDTFWDASDLPSGVYFCRLEAGGRMTLVKMVLVK